ncbi:MAG TPA: VWA domain-containing protein [Thermoanaerobaculia bacterium]|nr:VWA domain-containing protein [Thermoanaerobaculia bacterium]
MNRKLLSAVLALAVSTPAVLAQEETPIGKLVETIDVRVINIDVVVTDKRGNPITGLSADDFIILENGQSRTISNFYEIDNSKKPRGAAGEPPAASSPIATGAQEAEETPQNLRRKFIIFIDNLSLNPLNRNHVVETMKKFVESSVRPGDQAMVATWNRSMKIRVPFTGDTTQILQMLDVVKGESSFGMHNLSERKSVESQIRDSRTYEEAVVAARGYAQSVEHDVRQTITALNALMGTLAGVDGKKVLVLTTEGLPMQAGKEMFVFIDDMAREKTGWQRGGTALMEATHFDSTGLIQSIARTANANGITLYPLHAGGLSAYSHGSAEQSRPTSFIVQQAALSNHTDSLHLIADMTGGIATVGTNNFLAAFNRIEKDLDSYYSLGYRSGTERVDRQRRIEVRAKNRSHVVRARRSFVEKSTRTEMNDRVIANLFYDNTTNDLRVFLTTGRPIQIDAQTFRVPLEIHIPMETLTLLPQGEVMFGGFSVFVGVANKDGDMSDVREQSHQFQIPPPELEKLKGRHYTYALELIMEKGRNRISVGVVDDISNTTGFERQEVLAADLR